MNEVMRAWPPRLPTLQRPPSAPASMAHCLLLAALLHVWLVLWLGNAPGGTAAPGQGVWGAINVRLRGPVSDTPPAAPQPEPEPGGAPGQAVADRWGGAVRAQGPPPQAEPGAARLGQWGPAPAPSAVDGAALLAPPPVLAGELPALPQLSSATVSTAPPPAPAVPAAPRPWASPLARPAPASTAAPPLASPALAPAVPLAETVVPPPLQPAPLRALRAAPAVRQPASEQAAALARPIDQAAAQPLPDIAAPQALPTPTPRPPAPEPVLRALEAASLPAATAPAGSEALQAPAPPAAPAPALPTVPTVPGPVVADVPKGAAASPDAGTREGHDVATPASNAASAVPRLKLDLARPRGGELSRGSSRGVLPLLPRPPELDEKLARDIEKAAKTDCRKAYANSGLLAVVPLAADALGKSGACKW